MPEGMGYATNHGSHSGSTPHTKPKTTAQDSPVLSKTRGFGNHGNMSALGGLSQGKSGGFSQGTPQAHHQVGSAPGPSRGTTSPKVNDGPVDGPANPKSGSS